jgi:hypothetical protein
LPGFIDDPVPAVDMPFVHFGAALSGSFGDEPLDDDVDPVLEDDEDDDVDPELEEDDDVEDVDEPALPDDELVVVPSSFVPSSCGSVGSVDDVFFPAYALGDSVDPEQPATAPRPTERTSEARASDLFMERAP